MNYRAVKKTELEFTWSRFFAGVADRVGTIGVARTASRITELAADATYAGLSAAFELHRAYEQSRQALELLLEELANGLEESVHIEEFQKLFDQTATFELEAELRQRVRKAERKLAKARKAHKKAKKVPTSDVIEAALERLSEIEDEMEEIEMSKRAKRRRA